MICLPESFSTERLFMNRFVAQDAESIFYTYASKPEATRYVSWPVHQSIADTRAFLNYAYVAWHAGTDFSYSIRIKESNRFVGSIGCINNQGNIQIGYILGPLHWGKGYATEALTGMIKLLKDQHEVVRIGSFVDAENKASANVLMKAGMIEEARLEKWFRFINQDNQPKDCILFKYPLNR